MPDQHALRETVMTAARLLAVFSATFALFQLSEIWSLRLTFPYWDMVDVVHFMDTHALPSPRDLFAFVDNEHKPVFAFPLYYLDHLLGDGESTLLYIALYALVFALVALISVAATPHGVERLVMFCVLLPLFVSVLHYENLTWQKQVHVYLSLLFGAFACLLAAKEPEAQAKWQFPVAIMCAIVATFSFAFGLAAWPALAFAGAASRWPPIRWAVFAGALGASLALYLGGAGNGVKWLGTTPLEAIGLTPQTILYVLALMGVPVGLAVDGMLAQANTSHVSTGAGIGGALGAAVLVISAWRSGRIRSFPVLLLIFAVAVIGLIAVGRVNYLSVYESRYVVAPSLFWAALLLLAVTLFPARRIALISLAGVAVLVATVLASAQADRAMRAAIQKIHGAGTLATLRVHPDAPRVSKLHRSPDIAHAVWHRTRGSAGAFAARMPFGLIGHDARSTANDVRCIGQISTLKREEAIDGFVALTGWVAAGGDAPVRWLVVADANGVGTGATRPALRVRGVGALAAQFGTGIAVTDHTARGFSVLAKITNTQGLRLIAGLADGAICEVSLLHRSG